MPSYFAISKGKAARFDQALDAAGFEPSLVDELLERPDVMIGMREYACKAFSTTFTTPILDLRPHFNPDMVIAGMKEINHKRGKKYGWQFKASDFNALPEPPAWPSEAVLPAIVLCANLDTEGNTFNEACISAKSRQPQQWGHGLDLSELSLRFAEFEPNTLWWEAIDLAANWAPQKGRRVRDLTDPHLAHVQCLWAADQYPKVWVQAQNGRSVPFADMAGYRYIEGGVPCFFWSYGSQGLHVFCSDEGILDHDFAAPVVLGD